MKVNVHLKIDNSASQSMPINSDQISVIDPNDQSIKINVDPFFSTLINVDQDHIVLHCQPMRIIAVLIGIDQY